MTWSLLALLLWGCVRVQQAFGETHRTTLVNGTVAREGRLQIDIRGISGTVCSNEWTEKHAERLCKRFGYRGVEEYLVYKFGKGTTEIIWTNISGCIDNLDNTICDPDISLLNPSCNHSKDVGVICSQVRIRLVRPGSSRYRRTHDGRVEIYYFGKWSTVAGLHLGAANFICQNLGFPEAVFADCCGIFGHSTDMPAYRVTCVGGEKEITDCSLERTHYRPPVQSGVICAKDSLRLIGGDFPSQGRVEVFTDSVWHKVCTPDISMNAGRVICRQLHFDDVLDVVEVYSKNSISPTIKNVSCVGSEKRFEKCLFQTVSTGTCDTDVFLKCTASGSRLFDGFSRVEGFAQVYLNHSWRYVEGVRSGIDDAQENNLDVLNFICLKQHTSGLNVFRCENNYINYPTANCEIRDDVLYCTPHTQANRNRYICYTECSNDTLRIKRYMDKRLQVGLHSGFIEIFFNNAWNHICRDNWDLIATEVACKDLNFLGAADLDNLRNKGNRNSTYTLRAAVLWCDGSESSLHDCPRNDTSECSSGPVEVACISEGIRFQGSVVGYAGRVEVYSGEKWGPVCGYDWDLQDANVACTMKGFPSAVEAYHSAEFGAVLEDTFYRFDCSGDETSLYSCVHSTANSGYCDHYAGAGLICSQSTIRLQGGSSSTGRVELFIDGIWGTVCDDQWDFNDAFVACRQLGFSNASIVHIKGRYGEGTGVIHLDNVECTGTEIELQQCEHLDQHNCLHSEDAGVSCVQSESRRPGWLRTFNDVKIEGCHANWFRDSDRCLSVVQFEHDHSYNNITCPRNSVLLRSDTSLLTLTQYVYALYYYDSNATVIFLWRKRNSDICKTLNREIPAKRGSTWKELEVLCKGMHARAFVCQMNIEDQSRMCSSKLFKCLSGECILKSFVCDGNFDCRDHSDENEQCITECFQRLDASDYRGILDTTKDGTKCVLWTDANNPVDAVTPAKVFGKGIGNHNYCRNPNERCRAWCYSKEFYEVKDCAIEQCAEDSQLNCPATSFTCASGHCISYSFYCDHKPDCPDNSDEINCIFPECGKSDHECDNGRCLESLLRCNRIPDCIDKTDELKCGKCSDSYLRCSDGKCVPENHICDGKQDCHDGKDESMLTCSHMDTSTCGVNEIRCSNHLCADKQYICQLQMDEFGKIRGCQDRSHLNHCVLFACPAHTYKCPYSYCIPIKSRCDGINDCHDGEDEQYCDYYNCVGYFKCQDATNCISQFDICNGIKDCIRGDDELFCNVTCPDGCICDGLSFICFGTDWTADKANFISSEIRFLNLSRVVSRGSNEYIDERLFINTSALNFIGILDVSASGIRSIRPKYFENMQNLQNLYLQDNNISSLEDGVFKGLTRLQHLDISENAIKDYDINIFQDLKKLKRL
ncbi:uncharacterized protein LOC117111558 [Anneissia japonica]|uniref:uncharacterized protein LOC117111558 n=1 Tax=Anneissia japonica TaxID=1529436 RepID=UPI0014255360|nr:uncharacterized protein LOC117111558 [Anneissia japonica]